MHFLYTEMKVQYFFFFPNIKASTRQELKIDATSVSN